jgi:hypothetical protein
MPLSCNKLNIETIELASRFGTRSTIALSPSGVFVGVFVGVSVVGLPVLAGVTTGVITDVPVGETVGVRLSILVAVATVIGVAFVGCVVVESIVVGVKDAMVVMEGSVVTGMAVDVGGG